MKTYIFIGLSIKIDINLNKSLQRRPKRSSETSDELGKMLTFIVFIRMMLIINKTMVVIMSIENQGNWS